MVFSQFIDPRALDASIACMLFEKNGILAVIILSYNSTLFLSIDQFWNVCQGLDLTFIILFEREILDAFLPTKRN